MKTLGYALAEAAQAILSDDLEDAAVFSGLPLKTQMRYALDSLGHDQRAQTAETLLRRAGYSGERLSSILDYTFARGTLAERQLAADLCVYEALRLGLGSS